MSPETVNRNGKRKRSEDGLNETTIDPTILSPPCYTHTITSTQDTQIASRLLCVPIAFILRRSMTSSSSSSPLLLSKGEASLFLRVHLLARQLDHLVQLSYEALYRMSVCRYVSNNILTQSYHPSHRAWLPILYMHGYSQPERILHQYIPMEVRHILQVELHPLVRCLRDLADQNWNYVQLLQQQQQQKSTSSLSSMGVLPNLAWEKSIVAQIQEVLSHRIEHLIEKGLCSEPGEEEEQNDDDDDDDDSMNESMEDMCRRLTTPTQQLYIDSSEVASSSATAEAAATINIKTNLVVQQKNKDDVSLDLKSTHNEDPNPNRMNHCRETVSLLKEIEERKVETSENHPTDLPTPNHTMCEVETVHDSSYSCMDERKLSSFSQTSECWAQLYG